ncbi:hypothetical protein MKX03_024219 [Papaver bracteatum]|nr:hypothetical protein MKX03_024219 [Papaver bracteatum]
MSSSSSSIYSNLLRFSLTHLTSIITPSSSTQDVTSHYQHGIPGIPTDGKVFILKNSYNGAQFYLIGTNHVSKQSVETVKKVIDYVNPNVVAVGNAPYNCFRAIDHVLLSSSANFISYYSS